MPRGTITSFDSARGLGHIKLETGDQVHFDVSVATSPELKVGQVAEVITSWSTSRAIGTRWSR